MSTRKRLNSIIFLNVGEQVGSVTIWITVYDHFVNYFKLGNMLKLGVEDLNFNMVRETDKGELIKPFTEEYVINAV